jgi:predicted nucleotidyltransferase
MKEISPGMLDEILSRLVETLHPLEIYLFGSHARGTPHPDSDLDFLVVVPDDAGDRHELAGRGYIALYGLSVPIDLVVQYRHEMERWGAVRFSLRYEARQKGKLVYATTPSRKNRG